MAEHWFDDLARSAAAPVSRREAMRRVGAGLAGVMVAAVLPRRASARVPRLCPSPVCTDGKGVRGGVSCNGTCCPNDANKKNNYFCCPDGCKQLGSDEENCGNCGVACATGETCVNGICRGAVVITACALNHPHRITCGSTCCHRGDLCCGGACTDVSKDESNCGACGASCAPGEKCIDGVCCFCCNGTCCGEGQACCLGSCVECPPVFGPEGPGGGATCCGATCCALGKCCNGTECCGPAQQCCMGTCRDCPPLGGTCCGPTCCAPGKCCGGTDCCGPTQECCQGICRDCPPAGTCCGLTCCAPGNCCGGTECCRLDQQCCQGVCRDCPPLGTCCGLACCAPTKCCNGICCGPTESCVGGVCVVE